MINSANVCLYSYAAVLPRCGDAHAGCDMWGAPPQRSQPLPRPRKRQACSAQDSHGCMWGERLVLSGAEFSAFPASDEPSEGQQLPGYAPVQNIQG